jgi:hypothetical protein
MVTKKSTARVKNRISYYPRKSSSPKFDFPGFQFSTEALSMDKKTIDRFIAYTVWLYEWEQEEPSSSRRMVPIQRYYPAFLNSTKCLANAPYTKSVTINVGKIQRDTMVV